MTATLLTLAAVAVVLSGPIFFLGVVPVAIYFDQTEVSG